jgi:hypothetical protein
METACMYVCKLLAHGMRELTSLMLSVALIESFKGSINFSSRFPPEKSIDI